MSMPWLKFRNLCRYYIDCVKYSEKRQEYLFTDQLNESFLIPALPVNWHQKDKIEIPTSKEQRFVRSALLNADGSDEIFIGYPLTSFISPKGAHCLCPVMLFPVHVTTLGQGRTSGLMLEVDRQGIDINRDWVEFHVPRDRQNYFIRACERTDDAMGAMDVDNALQFISNHFKMRMDPNFMDFTLRHADAHRELLNTPVLIIGGKTKYTRNLIRELNQIRNEPDEILDRTSLAYVFRDPVKPIEMREGEGKVMPAVFTGQPMNAHQYAAVEASLNSPVVKVTGPPGTGKSHMSVNLIANEVFNGGSVLFASKNHKAIHAVYEMCQETKPDSDSELVEFCTVPGSDSAAQWDKMKDRLETVYDLAVARRKSQSLGERDVPDEVVYSALNAVDEALDRFRDAESDLRNYDELRSRTAKLERLLVRCDELLSAIPTSNRDSEEFVKLLEDCLLIVENDHRLGALQRLLLRIKICLKLTHPLPDVRKQLEVLVPGIAPAFSKKSSVSKSVRRLLKLLKFRKIVEGWRLEELEAVKAELSECNYDILKAELKKSLDTIASSLKMAYSDSVCKRVLSADVEDLISRIQGELKLVQAAPLEFMTSVGDPRRYDRVIDLFREYQKVFPAWAVTLLSLRKASPCLPGVFSLVLIDEASQCEIPPMIPELFRAKRVAVVGDPDQFPPVITMKPKRNAVLRKKYGLVESCMNKFSFCENNVFSVIPWNQDQTIHLVEHFRCADEIAMYFNDEFYKGGLCPCVGDRKNAGYEAYNLRPGMDFVDAPGGDAAEAAAAKEYLIRLKKSGFFGTVGVISPLRKVANEMKTICFENKDDMPEGLTDERINTANGFQGGQCDVIVFLLGLNSDRTPGRDGWYITAEENKYIYNVSVSRAKVCFTTFGDKNAALKCGIPRIVKLLPTERKSVNVKVGPGEIILQRALESAGLKPVPQYPICGRYLDLALVPEKVDIEIDGQAWHLDRNGCTKASDIHRDLILESQGWKVVRVWHHEVMGDVSKCVERVKDSLLANVNKA